jgi:pimeloyl-ACP methyl ester carboxylesterase
MIVHYRYAVVAGVDVSYREAGPSDAPVLLLRRPPTLVATGGNDEIFPEEVMRLILRDHPAAEYHALDTGHFALEDKADEIAALMRDFLPRAVQRAG